MQTPHLPHIPGATNISGPPTWTKLRTADEIFKEALNGGVKKGELIILGAFYRDMDTYERRTTPEREAAKYAIDELLADTTKE